MDIQCFSNKTRKFTSYAILVMFSLMSLLASPVYSSDTHINSIIITIRNDGVVEVCINGSISIGINEFRVPVEPIVPSIRVYLNNTRVTAVYFNNTLYVASIVEGEVHIFYLANITIEDGITLFTVHDTGVPVKLVVEPNIILLTIPSNVLNMSMVDGVIEIVFQGDTVIKYTVSVEEQPPKPVSKETKEITQEESEYGGQEAMPAPGISNEGLIPASIIVLAALIIGAILFFKKKASFREKIVAEYIDEIDKKIIEEIKRSGGEIYQSELQRRLDLPKATLWRHVNRLFQLGFIEVVKEGRLNKLVLKKHR